MRQDSYVIAMPADEDPAMVQEVEFPRSQLQGDGVVSELTLSLFGKRHPTFTA